MGWSNSRELQSEFNYIFIFYICIIILSQVLSVQWTSNLVIDVFVKKKKPLLYLLQIPAFDEMITGSTIVRTFILFFFIRFVLLNLVKSSFFFYLDRISSFLHDRCVSILKRLLQIIQCFEYTRKRVNDRDRLISSRVYNII